MKGKRQDSNRCPWTMHWGKGKFKHRSSPQYNSMKEKVVFQKRED